MFLFCIFNKSIIINNVELFQIVEEIITNKQTHRKEKLHARMGYLNYFIAQQAIVDSLRSQRPNRHFNGKVGSENRLAAVTVWLKPRDTAEIQQETVLFFLTRKQQINNKYMQFVSVWNAYFIQNADAEVKTDEKCIPTDPKQIPYCVLHGRGKQLIETIWFAWCISNYSPLQYIWHETGSSRRSQRSQKLCEKSWPVSVPTWSPGNRIPDAR